ncbi:MAG: hypothetical protein IPN17_30515 [Deltaproteobacteria bacterium]|nr:hypothetical protein [Deltaproteobacteria bacterium]
MEPWNRVWPSRRRPVGTRRRQISQKRFSAGQGRPETGAVQGYLLARDLIAVAAADEDWTRFVRPLRGRSADDDVGVDAALDAGRGKTVCSVEHGGDC